MAAGGWAALRDEFAEGVRAAASEVPAPKWQAGPPANGISTRLPRGVMQGACERSKARSA